jgi:hypothetical protein
MVLQLLLPVDSPMLDLGQLAGFIHEEAIRVQPFCFQSLSALLGLHSFAPLPYLEYL